MGGREGGRDRGKRREGERKEGREREGEGEERKERGREGIKSKSNQYSFNWQNTITDTDAKVVYIIPKLLDGRRTK